MSGRRWAILGASAVVVAGLFVGGRMLTDEDEVERFCSLQGSVGQTANGRAYPLEDQGAPGRDGCDVTEFPDNGDGFGPAYIGFDCQLHGTLYTPGTVMAPNRSDGTCGQADEPQ